MRISDWSSDVCSSDLRGRQSGTQHHFIERDRAEFRSRIAAQISVKLAEWGAGDAINQNLRRAHAGCAFGTTASCLIAAKSSLPFAVRGSSLRKSHCLGVRMPSRSEEHTSELQSLMRISYAVFCLKKKKSHCISD